MIFEDARLLGECIPWHDALFDGFALSRSPAGDIIITCLLEVNEEEDIAYLKRFKLHTRSLKILYANVWRFTADIRGDVIPSEVILDYEIMKQSPIIEDLHNQGSATKIELQHHQMKLSGGSRIDIVFEMMSASDQSLSS